MTINTATATKEDIKKAETSELLELYNKITGKNVKKFSSRGAAESQTWRAIEQLAPGEDIDATVKAAATKVKKEKVATTGKRADYENRIIEVHVKENPKRPGSRAHKKFAILMKFDGKTVGEYRAQEGKHAELDKETGWPSTEIRWSISLKLIKLHANTAAKAA